MDPDEEGNRIYFRLEERRMNTIKNYFKKRKAGLIGYLLFTIVYFGIFALYGVPMDAPVYAFIITFTLLVAFVVFDLFKYAKKVKIVDDLVKQERIDSDTFPESEDRVEICYQEMLKKLEDKMQELESVVYISRQEMKDYYGMWVHQIKTPIAALHVLLQSEELSARDMKQEVFKIEQYVEMVLTYLRMEEMSSDLRFERHALDEMVKQAVRKYSKMFILKKIGLDYQPLNMEVVTDDKWFVFVIEQLLSNALKYTKEGTISIYVEKGELVIEDTGIGIWPDDLPRVFERGFTGYNGHCDKKSTGIGLYLCKCILDQLHLSIRMESEIDHGTKVMIHLEQEEIQVE